MMKDHWTADSLPPAMIVGWFSWWIWCCFVIDFYCGVWSDWSSAALVYFAGDETLPFGSLPKMVFWMTLIALVLALCGLIWRPAKTWQGKAMTILAYLVLVGSAGYLIAVAKQEARIVERTWRLIHELDGGKGALDEWDQQRFEEAKSNHKRYTDRKNKRLE